MKKELILILFIVLTSVNLYSEENVSTEEESFDYGKIENNHYTNSFFKFSADVPSEWVIQSKKSTEDLMERGKDLVAGDDKNIRAMIKASEVNSAYLLTVFKYEVGSPVDYNPSFMIMAENVKSFPGLKNGNDYLFQARKLMRQSQIQYDYMDQEFAKQTIGNMEFYAMNVMIRYAGMEIRQIYYSTVINNFALSIIISYVTVEQKKELDAFLATVNFTE